MMKRIICSKELAYSSVAVIISIVPVEQVILSYAGNRSFAIYNGVVSDNLDCRAKRAVKKTQDL
jgi:hypothetical protein